MFVIFIWDKVDEWENKKWYKYVDDDLEVKYYVLICVILLCLGLRFFFFCLLFDDLIFLKIIVIIVF